MHHILQTVQDLMVFSAVFAFHAIIPAYTAVGQVIPNAPRVTKTHSLSSSQYQVQSFLK